MTAIGLSEVEAMEAWSAHYRRVERWALSHGQVRALLHQIVAVCDTLSRLASEVGCVREKKDSPLLFSAKPPPARVRNGELRTQVSYASETRRQLGAR